LIWNIEIGYDDYWISKVEISIYRLIKLSPDTRYICKISGMIKVIRVELSNCSEGDDEINWKALYSMYPVCQKVVSAISQEDLVHYVEAIEKCPVRCWAIWKYTYLHQVFPKVKMKLKIVYE